MLKVYNTLTKKKEMFIPLEKGKVGMYVCGPTVNGVPHAGHAKQKISFDVVARYLRYLGNKVNYVSNITDVDDKIIIGARNENIPVSEIVNKYIKAHKEAYAALELAPLTYEPRATEHIKDMVKFINILLKKKYAYLSADGSIYYDISKFKEYGKLSHTKIKELKEGASKRINNDEYEKDQANDFALWKA